MYIYTVENHWLLINTSTDQLQVSETPVMMAFKHCYLFWCWYLLIAGIVLRALTYSLCGEHDPLFKQELMNNLLRIRQQLNPPGCNPPKNRSCQEIFYCFPSSSSGYHQIHAANDSLIQVYCDMEGTNCGDVSGWTRVAFVNMTQPGSTALMVWHLERFPDSHCAVEVLALSHVRVQTSLHMASATHKCEDSFVVTSSWEHKHSKFQTPLMDPTSTAYLSHTEILVIIFGPTPVVFVQTAQMLYQHVHAISATPFKLHPL